MLGNLRVKLAEFSSHNAAKYGILLMVAVVLALVGLYIFAFAFKANVLVFSTVFTILGVFGYFTFKGNLDDQQKKMSLLLFKAIPIIFVPTVVAYPVLLLSKAMSASNMGGGGSILSLVVIFSLVAALGVIVFYKSRSGIKFFEGVAKTELAATDNDKLQNSGDVVLCNVKDDLDAGRADPREILPYKDRFLHMLILGATGTGKTSQILNPLINQDMQNPEIGLTILEPKGDLAQKAAMMAQHYGRPYVYFDPSLKDCPHFNPMFGKETDVVENMATTFRMLNPDSPQFFLDLNEQLMRNCVKVLKRLDKADGVDGRYATLINLSRLLQNSGGQGRALVQQFSRVASPTPDEAKENADIAGWFLNDYFAERSKVYENTSGVRSQVAKITSNEYLREILNPDIDKGDKNDVDFDKHLAEGGVICISTAQGTLRDLGRFLGYFIILQFQSATFRRPGNENTRRAHMLYIDEFQTYSNPGFSDMLTQGRSYRVASHLATQARAQMAMGAGKDGRNFVNLVSANARNIVLFPGCSFEDAKYYSDQFGEYEKTELVVGYSRKTFNVLTGGLDRLGHPSESIREQKKMTAVFSPSSLIYREFGEIVYCLIKNNSIQVPRVGKVSFIPKELNDTLDVMVDKYLAEHSFDTVMPDSSSPTMQQTWETLGELDDLGDGEEELPATEPTIGEAVGDIEPLDNFAPDIGSPNKAPIDWSPVPESAPKIDEDDPEILDDSGNVFDEIAQDDDII